MEVSETESEPGARAPTKCDRHTQPTPLALESASRTHTAMRAQAVVTNRSPPTAAIVKTFEVIVID